MDDWKVALDQAVRTSWADGKVFFVAQVKPFLAKQNIDLEPLLNGRQVRRFLESEMPELKQVQHDHEPTNWGLVPADANVETPTSKYFARSRTHQQFEFPYQNALKIAFTRGVHPPKGRTALHQLLGLILSGDLSRVSMPLDLVAGQDRRATDGGLSGLLPFALAGGGSFTTVKPSQHARTAADVSG